STASPITEVDAGARGHGIVRGLADAEVVRAKGDSLDDEGAGGGVVSAGDLAPGFVRLLEDRGDGDGSLGDAGELGVLSDPGAEGGAGDIRGAGATAHARAARGGGGGGRARRGPLARCRCRARARRGARAACAACAAAAIVAAP